MGQQIQRSGADQVQSDILIVEDHPLMQEMLMEMIVEAGGLKVSGVASTGEEALGYLDKTVPSMLLVDVSLPNMNGLDLAETVRQRWPDVRLIVLSGHADQLHVSRALSAGVDGFVVKGNPEEILDAIHRVLRGERYLSASVRSSDR